MRYQTALTSIVFVFNLSCHMYVVGYRQFNLLSKKKSKGSTSGGTKADRVESPPLGLVSVGLVSFGLVHLV